jgi:antitoxin component YwqK of YwqJK toxin-antitoxin module
MKFFFLIIFAISAGIAHAQQSLSKTTSVYNEDGKLQMSIHYNPSCSCRTYTEYYPDGKVYAKRIFKVTDKAEYVDGEEVTYYYDGSIKQFRFWKNAVPEGRAYSNYENGKMEHEAFYHDKYKSGKWKYYNKAGDLIREQIYEPRKTSWNSKAENVTIKYYAAGNLLFTNVYLNGKKVKSTQADSTAVKPKGKI